MQQVSEHPVYIIFREEEWRDKGKKGRRKEIKGKIEFF
jgi:hypothetical protein